jgi:S1-C subfamily serine protease
MTGCFSLARRSWTPTIWVAAYLAVVPRGVAAEPSDVRSGGALSQPAGQARSVQPPGPPARTRPHHRPSRYCLGTYSSDLVTFSPAARRLEEKTRYTFCIRSTAVYQCMYFGQDGSLQSRRETKVAHGTGFAFRREGGASYLLTNEHVIEWPFVTSKETPVDDVPAGCKRVNETSTIVDDEKDSYDKDDVLLQRVLADPELDVAVLKAPIQVDAIPFAFGQSAALKVGDAVRVRGFPLGAFQAVHSGKVNSTREPDQQGRWNHMDFVIDAQLSSGNSGSPVFAVNCSTGRLELVGIYHAGYIKGQSLNVVVGIDEFRDVMSTLKPRTRPKEPALTAGDRQRMIKALSRSATMPLLPFGGQTIGIRVVDGRLLYDVFPKKFPLVEWRVAVLEDLPSETFGRVGRIWFGNELGLAERAFAALKPAEQSLVTNLVDAIRRHYQQVLQFRANEPLAKTSRADFDKLRDIERAMSKKRPLYQSQIRALLDLATQYTPAPGTRGAPLAVTALPTPVVTPTSDKPAPEKSARPAQSEGTPSATR